MVSLFKPCAFKYIQRPRQMGKSIMSENARLHAEVNHLVGVLIEVEKERVFWEGCLCFWSAHTTSKIENALRKYMVKDVESVK